MKLLNRKNFRKDATGVAALEFAILLPFLLILLYGTYTVAMSILISRKVDNAVNDLGFIISREPRIATGNVNVNAQGNVTGCRTDGCTGGATRLNQIVDQLMPMLLYPNNSDSKYAVMISYVGVPINPSAGAPNTLRMMWSHQRSASGASNPDVNAQIGLESLCAPFQDTTTVNGVATTSSTYQEKYTSHPLPTDRATAVFPGQSFLVSTMRYQTDGFGAQTPHQGNLSTGDSLFDGSNFLRHSTYAIRSSWQDTNNNNRVDNSEFFNEMHFCTDCSSKTSRNVNESVAALAMRASECGTSGEAKLRMKCVDPAVTLGSANYNSSGCSFR